MSAAETLDPSILATMPPEVRAAIEEGPDPAEVAALERIANGSAPPDNDDDDDTAAADADAAVGQSAAKAAADGAAAPAADAAPPAESSAASEDPAPAPRQSGYHAALPEDYQAQLDQIKAEHTALRDKFKSGELDLDEYEEQRGALDQRREDLTIARAKAEIATEMTEQQARDRWTTAVNKHFAAAAKPEGGGIDYRKDANKASDLDLFVRRLANDPANADRDEAWFLAEGHKRVLALHGIAPVAPAGERQQPNAPDRKPRAEDAPRTLAGVPGGTEPVTRSEFDAMDSLSGPALELAISRMSPEQRARYAAGV